MEGPDAFAAFAVTSVPPEGADDRSHTPRYDDEHIAHTVEAAVGCGRRGRPGGASRIPSRRDERVGPARATRPHAVTL